MHLGSKDVVKLPYGRFGIWIAFNSSPITEATGTQQRGRKDALAVPCWLLCRNADTLIIRGLRMNFSRETEEWEYLTTFHSSWGCLHNQTVFAVM